MKRGLCLLMALVLWSALPAVAQDEPANFVARVSAPSAYVRAAPTQDAPTVASVFQDDALLVVGRNLDGTWFEVRRPGRLNTLGWIYYTLISWDFRQEQTPLTDLTTGLTGDRPLAADPGYAAYLLNDTPLRQRPFDGAQVGKVLFSVTVPVRARNQNGSWLFVNYLGVEGWINAFDTRRLPDVMAIPEQPGLPPLPSASVLIIPPDVQIGAIEQFRAYLDDQRAFTFELEGFWSHVFTGAIMPCEPPPFAQTYMATTLDQRAFPELEFLVPQLTEGLDYVNRSIQVMYTCGVVNPRVVIAARNDAINARIIFEATLGTLDNIESMITNR